MSKKEKLEKLMSELEGVNSDKDVRNFYTKAELIFSRLYGEQSIEFKKLKEIIEAYNMAAFSDAIGTGSVDISTVKNFKDDVKNFLGTLVELEDE